MIPTDDCRLVSTWAASQQSPRTRTAYAYEGTRLLSRLGKPLADATVADVQNYIAGSATWRRRRLGSRSRP